MKKIILILLIAVCFLAYASAVNIEITTNNSFKEGPISFDYKITATEDINLIYMPTVVCEKEAIPPLDFTTIEMQNGDIISSTYTYTNQAELLENQKCIAYINIENFEAESAAKEFTIDTPKKIEAEFFTCLDIECENQNIFFTKEEDIFINYFSDINNLTINATLTYPNKTKETIQLPFQLENKQIGTYLLEVEATKENYKPLNTKKNFEIIESDFTPQPLFEEETKTENKKTFDQAKKELENLNNLILVGGILGLLILLALIVFIFITINKNST